MINNEQLIVDKSSSENHSPQHSTILWKTTHFSLIIMSIYGNSMLNVYTQYTIYTLLIHYMTEDIFNVHSLYRSLIGM